MLKSCNYIQLKAFEKQLISLEPKLRLPDYISKEADRFFQLMKELFAGVEYTTVIKRKETQDVRVCYIFRVYVKEMKPFLKKEDNSMSSICNQWEHLFKLLGLSKRTDLAVRSPHDSKFDYRITIVLDDICLTEDLEKRFFLLKK